ncbi:hypothetical protein [Conexibacter sp. DBS9H8]|uniref:alpha/beta hydrolase family protein n=1 Tax=Conexibacter sp. DBS9H8 TaxID=2937801 RepID=UPI00200CA805|nr:hypothetical protein [Conexibacter sp. DBS9H8]
MIAGVLTLVVIAVVLIGAGGAGPVRVRPPATHTATKTATLTATRTRTVTPTRTTPAREPTSFAVGARNLVLNEPSTPSAATGTSGGQPVRTLPTLLLYPTFGRPGTPDRTGAPLDRAAGPYPLIIFSQGFDQPVSAYRGMLDAWAQAGFVVAAPTYPGTYAGDPHELDESDIVNHPGDLKFILSTLTADTTGSGGLSGLFNPNEVAVAGQSDGGDVSLAVAADSCCQISAIKAAVILSGAELSGFGGTYYTSGSVPLLVTQGSADTINLPGCSAELYDQAPAPKYYVDLLGQAHLPPYTQPGPANDYVNAAVIAFLDQYLRNRAGPWQRMVAAGGQTNVATVTDAPQLSGASTYCPA